MKRLLRSLDESAERYLMLTCYCFIVFVIVQEVFRRFVLNYSSSWAEELARYAFIYMGWIGASSAVKERAHIRFDVLFTRLPARLHGYLYIFIELCTFVFACIVLYWSMHTIWQLLQFGGTTPVLRVNKAWFEMAVPIGFVLMVVRIIQSLKRDIADIRVGRSAFEGKTMFEE